MSPEPRILSLKPSEPAAWDEAWPLVSGFPVLLACDHASARVPAPLGNLGLSAVDLGRHIAVDLGAADLTRALGALLGVPVVLSGYSRLVVDCNRHLDDPTAFPEVSDGTVIPGNRHLTPEDRAVRAATLYWPYHAAISRALDRLGPQPALLAIHSFTPELGGSSRPWHVGVLWDQDDRLATPLLRALRENRGLCVGDNEPYSGRHPAGYTVDAHAGNRGLPHVSIEVRQDLLATAGGVDRWAALLASALRPILAACSSPPGRPPIRRPAPADD